MSEPLDPNKYHVLTPELKRKLLLIGLPLFLVVFPLLSYFYYSFAINRPNQISKEITVEIEEGEGVVDISRKLSSLGVVNSEFLFNVYVLLNNRDEGIQAGKYVIPAGTSLVELVEMLEHGTNDIKMTFLEGWRIEEIAAYASVNLENIDYEDFVNLAADLEGRLFPDTYWVNAEITEAELIDLLASTFKEKTGKVLTEEALKKAQLTEKEALAFASIVEREVSKKEDRTKVAGILIKRYKADELIGADATTQYAVAKGKMGCVTDSKSLCPSYSLSLEMDWWPKNLEDDDIALDSLYNTRKNKGLPPTPISSFGLNALESVLNYEKTAYNYYLTDKNGVTHYSATYEEHLQKINAYLLNNRGD